MKKTPRSTRLRSLTLVGYGRFGAVLAALAQESGFHTRVFDPAAVIPSRLKSASLAAALAQPGIVVFAVPLQALEAAVERALPHVTPAHLVVDVCSVKVEPQRMLTRLLGRRIPWLGTHPLFGPTSYARGERPLTTVICPNRLHPAATAPVRAFFRRLGCELVEQTAAEHDRQMASTHVLTSFLGLGVLSAGIPMRPSVAPASFRALARVVEGVGDEAPQVLQTLQCFNPYAAAARRQLLRAFERVDAQLSGGRTPQVKAPGRR